MEQKIGFICRKAQYFHKISRHFEIYIRESKFLFASKDSGKILKIAREHLGNDKIVKLPTLIQIITAKIKNLFAK